MARVLIIEDEPVHLGVMKAKLEHEGYDVLSAVDGESGFQIIQKEKPDLVLLDIVLPKLDGFGVLKRMREEKLTMPVIVVSNSGQPVEVDRALELGAKDYLVKAEFNPADVIDKVAKILGNAPASLQRESTTAGTVRKKNASQESGGVQEAGNKINILIVEDDKFLRDLMVQKLKREGFKTLEAVDGEAGIKLAKDEHPDIILLDLILPGLDGFEILRRLKSDAAISPIPVIVLSNLGQKEDMERALSAGAEDFMVKAHFTPGEIVAKIKSILQKKYF